MATQTASARTAEFILTEDDGSLSRDNGTVASGQNLAAGTVLMDNGSGKLIAHDGTLNSDGTVATAVAGILIYAVDASAADTACSYVDYACEVKDAFLVYPTESTAGGEKAGCIASLLSLGIKVR